MKLKLDTMSTPIILHLESLKDNLNSQLELEAVLEKEWQSAKEKAKSTRTIFAQRSLNQVQPNCRN